MPTKVSIPADYDPLFIRDQAGAAMAFGYEARGEVTDIVFALDKFDAIQEAVAAYPVAHLAVELPPLIELIADYRRAAIEKFKLGDATIALDPETRSNLTGAALGLMRCPDILEIDWQVQPGVWTSLPREMVLGMADAAFRYVQACFTRARELTQLAQAAKDIYELRAIDPSEGWPE